MDLKLIISDAVQFFLDNAVQIARLCLPWLMAAAVVEYAMASLYRTPEGVGPLYMLSWVFNLLIYPVYTAALIYLMAARARQVRAADRDLLTASLRMWQPLFVVHVITAGLTAVGLMLFIIPGVYVAVRLSFAKFYLVLDNLKPIDAIQKSFEATKPYFFKILLTLALFVPPLLLLGLLLGHLLQGREAGMVLNVMISSATGFLMLFVEVVMFRIYMSATQEEPS